MDPKETLKQARSSMEWIQAFLDAGGLEYHDPEDDSDLETQISTLAESFCALDVWMTRGGFSPWGSGV